jgi:outer membrane protein
VAEGNYYPTVSLFGSVGSNYSNSQTQQVVGTTQALVPVGSVQGTNQVVVAPITQPVYGPYSFGSQFGNNFNQSVGLSVQIPIFNKYMARTSVKKAQLNYQNAELNTRITKNNLSKTIIQAILDLQAAEKQYQSSLQTFQANKDALNVTQQRYDVGLVNSLDYNTAVTNFNKSQNDMIEAKYSVVFRSKIIDYYLGNAITL